MARDSVREGSRNAAKAGCPTCGKEFWYYLSWPRKYCSHVCAGKGTVSNIRHFKPSRRTATCEQCGGEFEATAKRTRGRFCSQKCWGAWCAQHQVGAAHPNWLGGYAPYYGPSWRNARRAARRRDKVCRRCGKTPEHNGKALDVHHITPFRLYGIERHQEANDLSNLMALCAECHTRHEWATNRIDA